jgi:hypothetical protein
MTIKLSPEQAEKAGNELFETTKALVEKYKSGDMDTNKILARVGAVAMFAGVTRTTVLGSLVYSASMAPVVGISKETLIGLVSDLYDATEANPATPGAKEAYAESNTKFHAQQKTQGGTDLSGLSFNGLVSPGSKLKH